MGLLRQYISEIVSQKHDEKLLRESIRFTLKEIMAQIASEPTQEDEVDSGPSIPEPDEGFVEKMAVIWMKWAHRQELLETYERWKPFVERAGAGNNDKAERLSAYQELLDEIENPITYMSKAESASEYWTGLASLVPLQQQGQVMGERMAFRQGFVDDIIDKINSWIEEAASLAWDKFSENPIGTSKLLYDFWSSLPDFGSDISDETTVPSKAMFIGAFVQFVVQALGKRLLGLTGPAALVSATLALGQYFNYKSALASKADELIGDSSITLSNQFLPASLKDGRFLDTLKSAAKGLDNPMDFDELVASGVSPEHLKKIGVVPKKK